MKFILEQPKAFRLLSLIQMCESFSYYGMRAILVLYLIKSLLIGDSKAYAINAIFISLVELIRLTGGVIADKVLGLRYSIILGTFIISLGHIIMSVSDFNFSSENNLFYYGLGLIVLGSGLFKANAITLLGEFYGEKDQRRHSGYTLYYSSINVGSFIATILCGFISEAYGYKYGFGLAAIGMCLANFLIYFMSGYLENKGYKENLEISKVILTILAYFTMLPFLSYMIKASDILLNFMPFIMLLSLIIIIYSLKSLEKAQIKNVVIIGISIALLAIFYSMELQMSSSLIVFADNFVNLDIMGYKIPASVINAMNPLSIILLSPILAIFINKDSKAYGNNIKDFNYMSLGYLFMSIAFVLFGILAYFSVNQKISVILFLPVFAIIGFSELFVGPVVYTIATKLAPKGMKSSITGLVMFGYSCAGIIGGFVSKAFVISNNTKSTEVFTDNAIIISIAFITIFTLIRFTNYIINTKKYFN